MKKILIVLSIFIAINTISAQKQMKIVFKDGTEKTGDYKIKVPMLSSKPVIVSNKSNEKYNLEEIANLTIFDGMAASYYEVIDVKMNINDEKTKKKLGLQIHKSDKIELFHVEEGTNSTTIAAYDETYIRKKNDPVAYNIGYVYGADARGIKKRVRDYFSDCPQLVEKVDNNEIDKTKTLEIALFYENNCAK